MRKDFGTATNAPLGMITVIVRPNRGIIYLFPLSIAI